MHQKSLNETLADLGYTTRPSDSFVLAGLGSKVIEKDGVMVFEGRSRGVWAWLRERGEV